MIPISHLSSQRATPILWNSAAARDLLHLAHVGAVRAEEHDDERAGHEHRLEEDGQVDVRHDAVDADRDRRQEQADRAARRHEAEGEQVGVALLAEGGVQQAADGDDRDAAAAREHREDGARDDADDREASRHPAQHGARRRDQAVGRLRLGQHVADEGEERDRDDDRVIGEPLVEDGRRHEPEVVVGRVRVEHPEDLGRPAHHGEERRAEQREQDDQRGDDPAGDGDDQDGEPPRGPCRP